MEIDYGRVRFIGKTGRAGLVDFTDQKKNCDNGWDAGITFTAVSAANALRISVEIIPDGETRWKTKRDDRKSKPC